MSSSGFTSPFGANSNPFGTGRLDTSPMHRVAEEDENENITSPTTHTFGQSSTSGGTKFHGPFGNDGPSDLVNSGPRSPPFPETYPAQYNFARRTSVSAESLKPVADTYDNWTPPVHPKSEEQIERLKKAISGNFLFSHLDDEQSSQILGALVEKPIPAKGIKVRNMLWHDRHGSELTRRCRSLHKATRAISSTWSKKDPLISTSTVVARYSQDQMEWEPRLTPSWLGVHSESLL